jgi:predicted phosphodiesterase
VSGHTHHASAGSVEGLLIVNPDSVGEGVPNDPRPSWAWILAAPGGVSAGVRWSTRALRHYEIR